MLETASAATCLLCLLLSLSGVGSAATDAGRNPASPGPSSTPVSFESSGSTLQAHLYEGAGGGRRPTVLLLPGFPSEQGDDILGLAGPLTAQGWSVLVIHYRGVGTNDGLFTASHCLADVKAAVDFLERGDLAGVDPDWIVAVGHSFGGWTGLLTAARDPRIDCVAALTPANLGEWARQSAADPSVRQYLVDTLEATTTGTPARGLGGEGTVSEILEHEADFDLVAHAPRLAARPVLVVGAWRDTGTPLESHALPLVRVLQATDPDHLTPAILDADHNFTGVESRVHEIVASWLAVGCRSAGGGAISPH